MTTALAAAPTTTATTGDDDLDHVYCCDPDTALCGTDISGFTFADFDVADCVVCADLEAADAPCTRCGYGMAVAR